MSILIRTIFSNIGSFQNDNTGVQIVGDFANKFLAKKVKFSVTNMYTFTIITMFLYEPHFQCFTFVSFIYISYFPLK